MIKLKVKNKFKVKKLSELLKFHFFRLFILSYKFIILIIFIGLIGIISPVVVSLTHGENYSEEALMNQLSTDIPHYTPDFNDSNINNVMDMASEHSTLLPLVVLQGVTFGGMFSSMMASTIELKYIPQWTFGYTTGRVPFTSYGEPKTIDMGGFLLGKIPHGIFELPVIFFIFACGLMFGNYCYFRFKELIKRNLKFYPSTLSVIAYWFVFGMSIKMFAGNTSGMVGAVLIGIICLLIGQSLEEEYKIISFFDLFKGLLAIAIPSVLLLIIAAAVEILIDWNIIYNYFSEASFLGRIGVYGMTLFWCGVHIYAMLWVYKKGRSLNIIAMR